MLTITNNSIYFSEIPLSDLNSIELAEKINPKEIINFLSDVVELSESLNFKRLFDIISLNIGAFNEIFYTSLGSYPIEPYLQEIENNKTESTGSDYLELYWLCDKYDGELNISPSLHGINIKEQETYALDFVSLNNIKNHIVKINKSLVLYDYSATKSKKSDKSIIEVYLGEKSFTLFDLYNAILTEISYHGGPQDKKERFEDIQESIQESEKDIENSNTYVNFEEMIEKFESSDIYLVKYKDLRIRVDDDRLVDDKNIDKIKACLVEKLKIFYDIFKYKRDLNKYYKKLTDLEYNLQLLYGEDEDLSFHRFWDTPKCTCPKIDNIEIYPSTNPIFDDKCPIHGKPKVKKSKAS